MIKTRIRYPADSEVRTRVLELRTNGLSMKVIAKQLNISRSTVFEWLKKTPPIYVSDEARARAEIISKRGSEGTRRANLNRTNKWLLEAKNLWLNYYNDPLFMLGIGLYWGEGGKTRRQLSMTNSDSKVITVWMLWCRKFLPVTSKYSALIFVHDDVNRESALQHWSNVTNISNLIIVRCKPKSSQSRRPANILPYGTVRINLGIGSAEWHVKMMEWIRLAGMAEW